MLLWKIQEFCSVGGARSKKHLSRLLRYLLLSCTQPTGNSFTPNQWYWWKAETLKMCLLLTWRVCDQAFGRCRPLKGAKKWSCDHHENWNSAYRHTENFTNSKNAILFDLWRKTKISWKNCYRTVASPGACERLAILNWRLLSIHPSSWSNVFYINLWKRNFLFRWQKTWFI